VDWQPLIPKIRQVVLEEFDRNAYNQPVARVDRCTSCHVGGHDSRGTPADCQREKINAGKNREQ
jgi:hypothetical protein